MIMMMKENFGTPPISHLKRFSLLLGNFIQSVAFVNVFFFYKNDSLKFCSFKKINAVSTKVIKLICVGLNIFNTSLPH